MTLQPIETEYNGVKFRSRLEARWAIVFNELGIKWFYEYEGYQTSKGAYVPDFFLPKVSVRGNLRNGTFFEVKPESYEPASHDQLEEVATQGNFNAMLACGLYPVDGTSMERLYEIAPNWDAPMAIMPCVRCKTVKFEYPGGHYTDCPNCKHDMGWDEMEYIMSNAVKKALAYRFW